MTALVLAGCGASTAGHSTSANVPDDRSAGDADSDEADPTSDKPRATPRGNGTSHGDGSHSGPVTNPAQIP